MTPPLDLLRFGRLSTLTAGFVFLIACGAPPAENTLAESEPAAEVVTGAPEEPTPGIIHMVLFWLRDDLTDEERDAFVEGNLSISTIPSVRRLYFGPPAATAARAVVDNTFDYALILHFDDLAGQEAYQVHPLHQRMVEEYRDKWERVVVYDSEVMGAGE